MSIEFEAPIPIIRILSVDKALEFYRDFLGLTVDWEHRFAEHLPLYCEVSRNGMKFHLSEHRGDASTGSTCYVWVKHIDTFYEELRLKNSKYLTSGVQDEGEGRKELELTDPFGNRIRFGEPISKEG